QISISDMEARNQLNKSLANSEEKYNVIFLTVMNKNISNKEKTKIKAQFDKANEIYGKISNDVALNEIRNQYGNDGTVIIEGPIPYKKGGLKKIYEDSIHQNSEVLITDSFLDDGKVIIIWRI